MLCKDESTTTTKTSSSSNSRLLVDYRKDRAGPFADTGEARSTSTSSSSSNNQNNNNAQNNHLKTPVDSQDALSTVEYLLSLPMEDPMQDSFDLKSAATWSSCGCGDDDCGSEDDTSCASFAAEEDALSTAHKRESKSLPKPATNINRRASLTKSVSFTMRRSRRRLLEKSRTFDERLSTSERLHLSLRDLIMDPNNETNTTTANPIKQINIKPKTVIGGVKHKSDLKAAREHNYNQSLHGSLSFHESSKSIFGGKALKRQASLKQNLSAHSHSNSYSQSHFNSSISSFATSASTNTTATAMMLHESINTTTTSASTSANTLRNENNSNHWKTRRMQKLSDKQQQQNQKHTTTISSKGNDLSSLSSHSYFQKKKKQNQSNKNNNANKTTATTHCLPTTPQMAYFKQETSRRNLLSRSDSDSTIGDSSSTCGAVNGNNTMSDDSSVSMQISALHSRRGQIMTMKPNNHNHKNVNNGNANANSSGYNTSSTYTASYSSTSSYSLLHQDGSSSFLEASSSLFVTGSRIKRH